MKTFLCSLFLAASFFSAAQAYAQAAASIEGVQMPAWVERSGRRIPLFPGMDLRAGDQVFAGAGSRALVRLSEGSVVKLGENGTLRFSQLDRSTEIFRAALGVLQGAFRFTTDLVGKKNRREVDIRVAQVTAGIRGTDLWGRGRKGNEVVCLIEGEIQARAGGRCSVLLASAADQRAPLGLYDELRNAGYPAEILPRKEGEQLAYIIRIRQLPSRAGGQALADQLKGKFGITEPKVSG